MSFLFERECFVGATIGRPVLIAFRLSWLRLFVLNKSDMIVRVGNGSSHRYTMILSELPQQMTLIGVAKTQHSILYVKTERENGFAPQTLIAYQIAQLFGRRAGILMEQPFELACAELAVCGQFRHMHTAFGLQDIRHGIHQHWMQAVCVEIGEKEIFRMSAALCKIPGFIQHLDESADERGEVLAGVEAEVKAAAKRILHEKRSRPWIEADGKKLCTRIRRRSGDKGLVIERTVGCGDAVGSMVNGKDDIRTGIRNDGMGIGGRTARHAAP